MNTPYKFAKELAADLFGRYTEYDSSLYDPFNDDIPKEFIEKLTESEIHSKIMMLEIRADILFAIALEPEKFKNSDGEYEYQYWMFDYVYVMDSYVERMWKIINNTTDRGSARKLRDSIDYTKRLSESV